MPFSFITPCLVLVSLFGPDGLSVDRATHDFGRISPFRRMVHTFQLSNKGARPVKLLDLRPGCGCTVAQASESTVQPGATVGIQAVLDPATFRGKIRKGIEVLTDDPAQPRLFLALEAEVFQEILPSANAASFEGVPRDGGGIVSVRFTSASGRPVEVTDVLADRAPWLGFKVRREGGATVLDLLVYGSRLPRDASRWQEVIHVQTSAPTADLIPIQLTVTAGPGLP